MRIEVVGVLLSVLGVGCGSLQSLNPTHEHRFESKEGVQALSFDARTRGAYFIALKHSKKNNQGVAEEFVERTFCAEPAPDVAADTTERKKTNASLDLGIMQYFTGKGGGGSDGAAQVLTKALEGRTEAVVVLREAMYRLCELKAAGAIDSTQIVGLYQDILQTTSDLALRQVMEKLLAQGAQPPPQGNQPQGTQAQLAGLGDSVKAAMIAGAIKRIAIIPASAFGDGAVGSQTKDDIIKKLIAKF